MSGAGVLQLRCKTDTGTHRLTSKLYASSTLEELKNAIQLVSGVEPNFQKIMTGFPPKAMDVSDSTQTLGTLNIRSGDTFTLVDIDRKSKLLQKQMEIKPEMKRQEVPADNSCLFYSVYFALHGDKIDQRLFNEAKKFRAKIANVVMSDRNKYTEAFLGKMPEEYGVWIQCDTSWGGGIELSILSEMFQMEIVGIDIQTLRTDIFGQDKNYSTRIFVLYDGIHYDPIYLDPGAPGLPFQTIFSTDDDSALMQAVEVARKANKARQYVDVGNFSLRCLTCNTRLTGQKEAREHAEKTGHGNFGEI